jgi:putative proteasome-type protease
MRSNVTVGPPIDLTVYVRNELRISQHRRFDAKDPDLRDIQTRWERSLRKGVSELPEIRFEDPEAKPKSPRDERDPTADAGLAD